MVSGDSSSNIDNIGSIGDIGDIGNIHRTANSNNAGNTGNIHRIDSIQTIQTHNGTRAQVRSQLHDDSHNMQILRQQASAVSHALWPSNLHRSEALSKTPKRRRNMLSNHTRFIRGTRAVPEYTSLLLVATAIIVVSSIVTALLLHRWFILLIPIFMLTFTSLMLLQAFFERMQGNIQQSGKLFIQQTPQSFKSFPGIPTSRRAFDTPMPKTPLVRELETYDLSQSNVEHFLDARTTRDNKEHALEK